MKKVLAILLFICCFSIYSCSNIQAYTDDSDADTSLGTGESTDLSTQAPETSAKKTVEDASTFGEAFDIILPEIDLTVENVSKVAVRGDKFVSAENRDEIAEVVDSVNNAPLVRYEEGSAAPGWEKLLVFYGNDGEELCSFRLTENSLHIDYGVHQLTTEEGYFTELCDFVLGFTTKK